MTSSNTPLRSSVKVLKLFVTSLYSGGSEDNLGPLVLTERYKKQIEKHNNSFYNDAHCDSGFDLYIPETFEVPPGENLMVYLDIKAAMFQVTPEDVKPMPYYIYPRSSMGSKTKLRLANSVGIIDSGYRGELMAVFDNINHNQAHECEAGTRLLQICSGSLEPFIVKLVDLESELGVTVRGEGGFGSTGD